MKPAKTHNLTTRGNVRKQRKSTGHKIRRSCCVLILFLHYLRHKAAHSPGGLILFLTGGVGIGAEGKPGVVVTQHSGYGFHVHTVLQCHGMGDGVRAAPG